MFLSNRQEREKERKREEILQVAEKLFFSGDYVSISMDEIAEKAEFSKRTVYKYFTSKEELYSAIALKGMDLLKVIIEKSLNPMENGYQKLVSLGKAFVELTRKNINYVQVISYFIKKLNDPGKAGSYTERCTEGVNRLMGLIHTVVSDGIKDGSLKEDLEPVITIETFKMLYLGLMMINKDVWKTYRSHSDLSYEEVFENGMNMILRSVKN